MQQSSRPKRFSGCGSFRAGTRIAVPPGQATHAARPIEDLRPGDRVISKCPGAETLAVRHCMKLPGPNAALHDRPSPLVRLLAGALGTDHPRHDTLLPQDALLAFTIAVDRRQMLVPVGALVNGASITRQPAPAATVWYSLQLEGHGVVLADDIAAASAISSPPASRAARSQRPGKRKPGLAETDTATLLGLPLLLPGADLLALRRALVEISTAQLRMPGASFAAGLTQTDPPDDPDTPIALFVDGVRRPPEPDSGPTRLHFLLPRGSGPARLISPASTSPEPDDTRRLGLCVIGIEVDGELLALAGPAPGPGFHAVEQDGATNWRWTDGAAWLALPHADTERHLVLHINDWHLGLGAAEPATTPI